MKRLLVVIIALALAATTLVTLAPPATASKAGCSVKWGSLVKEMPATVSGELTGIRTGRHKCFDRLVLDLNGAAPGYRVSYVKNVTQDGSGNTVAVKGGALIQVVAIAPAYDEQGNATVDIAAVDATNVRGYKTLRDIAWAGSFEGQTTIGVGVRARLPFRVFTLDGPGKGSRLVIDVAHRW